MPSARWHRSVATCALALAVAAVPLRSAHAADPTHTCVEAAHEGQELRDAGHLTAARAELLRCADAACPEIVRESCAKWITEIDARLPTLVLGAHDERGADLPSARVTIDGKLVDHALDGRSLAVDPGPHEIVFQAPGRTAIRQTVIAREGDKMRPVVGTLARENPSSSQAHAGSSARGPSLAPVVVAGAVTAVALGTFAVFGALGESQKSDLEDSCAPTQTCDPSDVDAARTKLIVADVGLLVAIASGAVTTFLLVRHIGRDTAPPPTRAAWSFGGAPMAGGAFASVVGRY